MAQQHHHERMILDVSFIHPCSDTYMHAAACTDGAAAQRRDEDKRHHYCSALPATFSSRVKVIPLSLEVFGRLGKPASQHLNLLGTIAASTGVVDKRAFIDQALCELAAASSHSAWSMKARLSTTPVDAAMVPNRFKCWDAGLPRRPNTSRLRGMTLTLEEKVAGRAEQ